MSPRESIAHYRIVCKLGEGGMGVVYQATDTRLNRDVAIKVLPDALAGDPDYLARFTREAQVLASVNHPNIAAIYGVEDRALVMELVPGLTLEERIAAGPVPLEEALGIARQIAEALEAAHERGVIHRDLKPANVKVTAEALVKVLDFGLAKAADPVSSASAANSPTLTIRATQAGLIMGTAGYMAPEQAAGKPVDRRADIWSFGVVLYEMLSGRKLFTGETISHTLASVLKDRIDLAILDVPPPIRRLLARCLHRDPKERLRDIGEARIAIRDYLSNPAAETEPAKAPEDAIRINAPGYWLSRAAFAILTLALVAALAWIFRPAPAKLVMRFSVPLGENQNFTNVGRRVLVLSPDGTQMVYVANRRLYRRSMADSEARPISGADGGVGGAILGPVFSPDGKSVAYDDRGSNSLKRIALDGGAPLTLCPVRSFFGMSWDERGIVFGTLGQGILRVSEKGGRLEQLIASKDNELMAEPQMLPGGEAVLYSLVEYTGNGTTSWDKAVIIAQNLKSGVRKILVQNAMGARYLPTGHLVYAVGGVLFAVPFDPQRLETTGNPVGMVEGVMRGAGVAQYGFSNSGTLVFLSGPVATAADGESILVLVDRSGEVEPLKVAPAALAFPRASRDGKRIAYQIDDGKESGVWVWELGGGAAPRRLTLPGSGGNRFPIWSADGQQVAFQSDREGDRGIWWQRADGSGTAERLTRPAQGVTHIPDSWSPDGQTFSFTEQKDNTSEIWTYSLRDRKATVFAAVTKTILGRSIFSPDGKWVAYQVTAQPNSRVYVRPFPTTSTAYLAPVDGDMHHPVWSPDGKELIYVAGASQVGSMSISTQPSVSFGSPVRAPTSGFHTSVPGSIRTFDILPDGKHFIGVVAAARVQSAAQNVQQIQVVLNWFEDLKRRAGK